MRIGVQNTDWEYIGAKLATETDEDQAKFFRGFVKEAKTFGSHYQTEMQMMSINKLLTSEEREVLGAISHEA